MTAVQILQALSHNPLTLVMDASAVGRSCQVPMVGVVYRKRPLPLVWLVYRGKKGHTDAERHIAVLKKLQPLIPAGAEVVLLGDAEYDNTDLLLWLAAHTEWQYVLRASPQIYVHSQLGAHPVAGLPLHQEQVRQYRQVGFTKAAPVAVNLVGWWAAGMNSRFTCSAIWPAST